MYIMSNVTVAINNVDDITSNLTIGIIIQTDKNPNNIYKDILFKHLTEFNKRYDDIFACYKNSSSLKRELELEMNVFETVQINDTRIKELHKQILALTKKTEIINNDSSVVKSNSNISVAR